MISGENIELVASEAAKIKRDYPHLTFQQAIDKSKEVLKDKLKIDIRSDKDGNFGSRSKR